MHILPALPDSWTEGEIKGLLARGGFEVDITWKDGKPGKATVKSTIGGTLRLRSYWPLKGRGLNEASGKCPNALMASADIKEPIRSSELKEFRLMDLKPVYEYDLDTKAGNTYTLTISE